MHRFIPSPGAPASAASIDPAHTAAIKRWAAETLRLNDDAVVTVSEIACADAGCPLLETTIAVFETTRTRRWKLTRPRAAVTKMMIQQTLATPPSGPRPEADDASRTPA